VRADPVSRLDTMVEVVCLNFRRPIVLGREKEVGGCFVFVTWYIFLLN